ncbi:DUF4397 domain-containing protein [Photobacterium lutimaris]|uniref:DUF4397 domain-containing protein n=1 Tax=Photobacterium lutimaris TaxID=388278 RepID=A0A2T3IY85_9GAMM|nr:DUF4397 domain-containing protein [Photobacterium lutimaris]PSU33556.1 DUF4397 domain-containing protein [Photobacterium lutimaris]TDR74605.1 uncharacterized protein DUF4397 [Photobacterium lutimaris]
MNAKPLTLAVISAIALAGCLDSDDDDTTTATSKLRVTHASSDAPLVAINLNGETVDGLERVDYQVASGLLTIDSGAYEVAVEALLTGEDTLEVINENLDFAPDMQYDVFAVGQTADIAPVVLSREDIAPTGDEVRLDVLHAHPDVPPVDIYLTTDDEITDVDPAVPGLGFAIDSDILPVTVGAGTYRIRITVSGSKDIAFDSGELDLAGGSDLMISAVPNVGGGAVSPVNLLVADGEAVAVLRNIGEKATVRVVHAVDDAPAVDVLASGAPVDGLTNIEFKEFRSLDVDAGSYDLAVAASSDNTLVVIEAPGVEFTAGSATSIYAMGKLNSITDETIEPVVIEEDLRSVATYAKVRVVHASPTAGGLGLVNIHASADGMFSESTVVLEGVDFTDSAVINVPAGTYMLAVILQGDDTFTPAVEATAMVENGGVYSVVATDDFAGGLLLNVDNSADADADADAETE